MSCIPSWRPFKAAIDTNKEDTPVLKFDDFSRTYVCIVNGKVGVGVGVGARK